MIIYTEGPGGWEGAWGPLRERSQHGQWDCSLEHWVPEISTVDDFVHHRALIKKNFFNFKKQYTDIVKQQVIELTHRNLLKICMQTS